MVRAKKRFGQNFLRDSAVKQKIIEAMPDQTVKIVEIGPGLGDLTASILRTRELTAIEIDTDLCEELERRFAPEIASGRLVLRNGDVLELWRTSLLDHRYAIVANLPYYAAAEIILRALRDPNCVSILVMVQLDMARKFAGLDGSNPLSLLTATVGNAELLFEVPPTAFTPVPKVFSAVLRITKQQGAYDRGFSEFLREAFTQPRKRLLTNIKGERSRTIAAFVATRLDENIRAHQLTLEEFHKLYTLLKGQMNGRESRQPA
ncbi:ribosomal RNA small subunit methyltransferase A [Campylobacterota bacterium]|nr:ribosomal RNA small subunit methyltransferase A [Campylobacterota bacterium]